MKKISILLMVALLLTALVPAAALAQDPVRVYVDGQVVTFTNPPVLEEGTTLVEFRPIFERLGLTVDWDPDTRTVTGSKEGLRIELRIGVSTALVNGRQVPLRLAPRIQNGRTLVPLRFVSEEAGFPVHWDGAARRVLIGSTDTVPPSGDILQVAAGAAHMLALAGDGQVYVWGANNRGQLGLGDGIERTRPQALGGLPLVSALAGGGSHSMALRPDGGLWTWGLNIYGQLGSGNTVDRSRPGEIDLSAITQISAGGLFRPVSLGDGRTREQSAHSLALRSDGTVFAWGSNDRGQLGDGTKVDRTRPTAIAGLGSVRQVQAGGFHSLALGTDGRVYSWGDNRYGQLGDDSMVDRTRPVAVSGLSRVSAVAAGGNHSLALTEDGRAYAWGSNRYGQLGDGTLLERDQPVAVAGLTGVIAVAAGDNHSLALRSDGTVWAWGLNEDGQLGTGIRVERRSPAQVDGLANVRQIVAGEGFSAALTAGGEVWCWGRNNRGQLGIGGFTERTRPQQVVFPAP